MQWISAILTLLRTANGLKCHQVIDWYKLIVISALKIILLSWPQNGQSSTPRSRRLQIRVILLPSKCVMRSDVSLSAKSGDRRRWELLYTTSEHKRGGVKKYLWCTDILEFTDKEGRGAKDPKNMWRLILKPPLAPDLICEPPLSLSSSRHRPSTVPLSNYVSISEIGAKTPLSSLFCSVNSRGV